MNKEKYKLFSCCLPVKGFKRSLIIDNQRQNFDFITNDLYDILSNFETISIDVLNKKYPNSINIIYDYLDFLKENEYVFKFDSAEKGVFPKIDLAWKYPGVITNAIIECRNDGFNSLLSKERINEIESLGCRSVLINILGLIKHRELDNILSIFSESAIKSIEINIQFKNELTKEQITRLLEKHLRLRVLTVFGNSNFFIMNSKKSEVGVCVFSNNEYDAYNCGRIDASLFVNNIQSFTESQCHNTCLNRKISISSDGFIKNCPSMKHNYGHISETTLEEAIEKTGFKDLWFIRKDDIDVCQDCEFRHVCTDCRAFIKDPENIYSQPAKCGYNPYIALWEGQEDWISVKQWRQENPDWEKKVLENRKTYKTEDCSQYHK